MSHSMFSFTLLHLIIKLMLLSKKEEHLKQFIIYESIKCTVPRGRVARLCAFVINYLSVYFYNDLKKYVDTWKLGLLIFNELCIVSVSSRLSILTICTFSVCYLQPGILFICHERSNGWLRMNYFASSGGFLTTPGLLLN